MIHPHENRIDRASCVVEVFTVGVVYIRCSERDGRDKRSICDD